MNRIPAVALALAFAVPAAGDEKPAPAVALTELPDRLRIELGGELFTDYIHQGEERHFPLFYPVLGPGQVPMTRSYPLEIVEGEDTDHPHHESLWFAHSNVNGETFWATRPYGDRTPGRQVHQGFKEIASGEEGGHFIAETAYVAPDERIVMTDTRVVRFFPPSGEDATRLLDITITFHASHGEVVFGDEKDAGMAIRVASDLQGTRRTQPAEGAPAPPAGILVNSEGHLGDDTWGKRARWVDIHGKVGGQPVGVAILDHPSNPRHPTWWHARTYGLVTANIFGKHSFEKDPDRDAGVLVIPAGDSATFRWRFAFHRGGPEDAGVERLFEAFAAGN